MSFAHTKTGAVGILGLQAGEDVNEKDDLVVDNCGGWMTTARAAQNLGRRWLTTELMGEHILGGALRFQNDPGFELFGGLEAA